MAGESGHIDCMETTKQGVNKMAYAYTVKGSEDGIIGVFGNVQRAKDKAQEYTQGQLVDTWKNVESGVWMWIYESDTNGSITAEVEKWWIE